MAHQVMNDAHIEPNIVALKVIGNDMSKFRQQLLDVMNDFTEDIKIPDVQLDMVLFTWYRMNDLGIGWDEVKAAAMLLNILYRDGLIHQDQITAEGSIAMKWAEDYLEDTNVVTILSQYKTSNPDIKKPTL